MEWVPTVLITFKVLVLTIGMYFAVKWHYDKNRKDRQTVLRASVTAAIIFLLSLMALGLLTYFLAKKLGLDLNMP
jgi:glucosamine 6-phosphate synthetase-like amidotransferase/phosphosugar isomerase protein